MKTKLELTKFLEKNLDYDANQTFYCPECKHKELSYWIDHKGSLTGNVASFLGFKNKSWDDDGIGGLIYDVINDFYFVTGNAQKDAPLLAEEILKLL